MTTPPFSSTRRRLLQAGTGIAAALPLALPTFSAHSQQATSPSAPSTPPPPPAGVLTKTIARTDETVSALGLGTFLTFDALPGQPRDNLREVVKRYWDGGVRLLDTSPLYGSGETTVGDFITGLGIGALISLAAPLRSFAHIGTSPQRRRSRCRSPSSGL